MVGFIAPYWSPLALGGVAALGGAQEFLSALVLAFAPHTSNMASQQTPAVFRWVSSTAKLNVGWIEHISSHFLHGFCFSHERNGWTAAFSDTVMCFSCRKRWVAWCSKTKKSSPPWFCSLTAPGFPHGGGCFSSLSHTRCQSGAANWTMRSQAKLTGVALGSHRCPLSVITLAIPLCHRTVQRSPDHRSTSTAILNQAEIDSPGSSFCV